MKPLPPVRTYRVTVYGYTNADYSARTPAKAMYRAYRDFDDAFPGRWTFHRFLTEARVRRISDPPGIGKRILVRGEPATRCLGRGDHYVWFMRDDSDQVVCAHHLDVASA